MYLGRHRGMKNRLRDWLRRHMPPQGESLSRKDEEGNGVEHLRVGQRLVRDGMPQDSISLILQGCCESEKPREAAPLHAGDVVDGEDRLDMHAMVESEVLRFPRKNIRRLLERWPGMFKPGAPSSVRMAPPPAKRKGYGKVLCLMPLSDGIPCEEFASVCAETIVRETGEAVLCVKVDNMGAEPAGKRPSVSFAGSAGCLHPAGPCGKRFAIIASAFETAGSRARAIPLCDR